MKISGLTIFLGFVAIAMITLTYGFAKRQPVMKTVENWKNYRDKMRAEQAKWKQADDKVLDAAKKGQAKVAEWNQISQSHTLPSIPDPFGIDLSLDGERLAMQMPAYRNRLQAMVNNQVKAGGVTVVQGPVVPLPPLQGDKIVASYFNYPAINTPVLVFNLGTITVQGTFQQISDNVKAWSNMPHFLAVADGLRLQGTSPKLTGTYAVTIVGFVALPPNKGIFPPVPDGARIASLIQTPPPTGAPGAPATTPAPPAKGTAAAAAKGAAANKGGARVPGRNQGGGGG